MEVTVTQTMNIPEIIRSYSNRLTGFIKKRVNRREDAEDILQDVFFQLAEADRLMKPIDQMASWLFTVARNRITDLYRKKSPELYAEFYTTEDDELVIEEFADYFEGSNTTPETQLIRALVMEVFENALNDLPEEQRTVFEMTELMGIPFKEIALETGEPINTLISRKHYAVLFLRERLKTLYKELIEY